VSFEPGTVTSVIGANGAGKSTLLKAIFGMVGVTSGDVRYLGRTIAHLKPDQRLREGIAIVLQGRCNFPLMTVRENLELGAYTRSDGRVGQDIEAVLDVFDVLRRKQKVIAGNLSGGEQQMLEMAMVLMVQPRVMLLDEPSLGLSPLMLDYVFDAIRDLARHRNTAIVMVEQNAVQALKISDRGIVLELGRVSHEGSGPQMLDSPTVRQSYLGLPPT
jgi:branched-chain amino acid transport system ATP-binding protein